jgi:peptidoglycan/xylan/chitin deacetylase (PgdA/CDA1 family)
MLYIGMKKIKLIFMAVIAALVIALIFGVTHLDGDYYWQKKYVEMQWIFFSTRVEYFVKSHFGMEEAKKSIPENLSSISVSGSAKSVPILLYHGVIQDPNWKEDDVNIGFSDFREQMMLLKLLGYETVSMDDFISYINGERSLPSKSFLLTFDDGRKDSYYPVDPILKALGYRATMFVITGRSLDQTKEENTFHLNETELKKMVESSRWDIESHTTNGHDFEKINANGDKGHFLSNKIWLKYEGRIENDEEYKKRVESDLAQSKSDLENKLGVKVQAFAYPFGDYGTGNINYPESKDMILSTVKNIFPYSFYQMRNSDFIGNYPENQILFRRYPVTSALKPKDLAIMFLNSLDKRDTKYQDSFAGDNGWIEGWGMRQFQGGLMLTGPTNSEDSSLTFLDGAYLWKDYTFLGRVQLMRGKSFAFLGRYKNGDNYISCDYGAEYISINEHINGEETRIAEIAISSNAYANEAEAGVSVNGQNISCYFAGKPILTAVADNSFDHGGIGLKTWDNEVHNSELLVKSINVNNITFTNKSSFRGAISLYSQNAR